MKLKKKVIIIGSIIIVLLIAGALFFFLKKDDKNIAKVLPKKVKEEEPEVQIIDVNSDSRPIAVMINNLNDARKVQSGLTEAYMVYEIIVEGGITRYLALFKDTNTAKIGSVRSSRHYYLDYALENDAIYVHWGWSPQAQSDIKSLKINNINGLYDSGFFRDNPLGLATEHTGFTTMENILKTAEKKGYRTTTEEKPLLKYNARSLKLDKYSDNVETADEVTIVYSNYITDNYKYDVENKVYNRYVNGKIQRDFAADKDLTVKNIIFYQVDNYGLNDGSGKGRQGLDNLGSGEGYYISEGKAVKITWSKESRENKTVYKFENGEELIVNDGNTFIQIVPTEGSISIKSNEVVPEDKNE